LQDGIVRRMDTCFRSVPMRCPEMRYLEEVRNMHYEATLCLRCGETTAPPKALSSFKLLILASREDLERASLAVHMHKRFCPNCK